METLIMPTTCSDNAKPWEPPEPQDPALQCRDCGKNKHGKNTGYHRTEARDIKDCCGVCRTSRLANGKLFCTFGEDESVVGHFHVCDAICRLYSSEIRKRYEPWMKNYD